MKDEDFEVSTSKLKKHHDQYPTKNFLNKFKNIHFFFLRKKHLNFKKWRNMEELEKRKWTTMKDYEEMYTTPEFTE